MDQSSVTRGSRPRPIVCINPICTKKANSTVVLLATSSSVFLSYQISASLPANNIFLIINQHQPPATSHSQTNRIASRGKGMAGSSSVRGARVRKWLEVVNEEEGVAKCSGTEWYKHVTEELCPCKNVSFLPFHNPHSLLDCSPLETV